MNIHPLLPASLGLVGAFTGRLFFGRWFNHLTLYSVIWGTGLALFEVRLMNYYPLTVEVWLMVGYSWIAFAAGSVTLILAKAAVGDSWQAPAMEGATPSFREKKTLLFFILVLSTVALVAVLQHWSILMKRFGGVMGVLLNGARIYHLTVAGKIGGKIAYIDSFGLTAVCLAGIYSAKSGRVKLLVLLPLVTIILSDMAHGGRAKVILAGILFFSAYSFTRLLPGSAKALQAANRGRRLLATALVLAVMLTAIDFIRSYRGAMERFYGTSKELSKLENNAFLTPSIYLYLSSHVGVFNAYWKAGGEQAFPGSNSFAPVFRVLSRLELIDYVPYFTKFYNIPISTNTGTYLREIHTDFGIAGILIAPYVLGFLCTLVWFRIKRYATFTSVALLAHLYVIVAFSYFYQVTRLGQWAVSLIVALLLCSFIDHRDYLRAAMASIQPRERRS